MNGKTYEIHGCIVEMSSGMQTAKVRRLEIKAPVLDGDGKPVGEKVIQSAVEAEFKTKVERRDDEDVTISAQEQAHLWARDLPAIVDQQAVNVRGKAKRARGDK